MQTRRDSFLRLVKSFYWQQVDEGVLPAQSYVVLELLNSLDVALDRINEGLFDWKCCEDHYQIFRSNKAGLSKLIRSCAPTVVVKKAEDVTETDETMLICMLLCFIDAHEKAQGIVLEMQEHLQALHDNAANQADQMAKKHMLKVNERVVAESGESVVKARKMLATLDQNMQLLMKTQQVASILLDCQSDLTLQWFERGIFTEQNAHHVLEDVEKQQANLAKVVKNMGAAAMMDGEFTKSGKAKANTTSSGRGYNRMDA